MCAYSHIAISAASHQVTRIKNVVGELELLKACCCARHMTSCSFCFWSNGDLGNLSSLLVSSFKNLSPSASNNIFTLICVCEILRRHLHNDYLAPAINMELQLNLRRATSFFAISLSAAQRLCAVYNNTNSTHISISRR